MMKTLIFEGAGWEKAESSVNSGVGNCRIRTRLRNDEGRLIYLEMSGWIFPGKKPEYAKPFNAVGHVNFCFYNDSAWDSNRCVSSGLNTFEPHFEYSRKNIIALVNRHLHCSFDAIEVINDGSAYMHTNDPLCTSIEGEYTPYSDPIVNISTMDGITRLIEYPSYRMAKYQIPYKFVKRIPFIKRWIDDRSEREQAQFPKYTYYVNLRWDIDGTITSAEITSSQNFANFGIGLDTLHQTVAELLTQAAQAVTV